AEKTGEGQVVETSLFETAVWTQATDYAITAVDKAPVRRRMRNQQITATANRYPCGDGKWIVINNPEQAAWPRFCKAIGQEAWLEKEEWIDQRSRFYAMADVVAAIDEVLATKSRDEWGAIFDAAGLIWGPVLSLDEVAKDPQAQAIGLFPTIESEVVGSYHSVRIPMRMPRAKIGPKGPAPAVGAHTASVLEGLGRSASAIEALVAGGIVKGEDA
ncbi:MAG: CoA transferase, partial [Pseudomonadota bacterium]|nr:CoA transferase [Pseudomonadota bacterium]